MDGVSSSSGAPTDPGEVHIAVGAAPAGEEASRLYSETERESVFK